MALRLYADECVSGRVVAGLRHRNVDVVTVAEQGLLSASDERHVENATALGRVIVTADDDFLALAKALGERGERFPGVLFIKRDATIGDAVHAIALAAEILDPVDVASKVEWVP